MISLSGHLFFDNVTGDRERRFYKVAQRTSVAFVICALALAWAHDKPHAALFAPQEILLLRSRSRSDLFISTCFVFVICLYTLAELTRGASFGFIMLELAYRQRKVAALALEHLVDVQEKEKRAFEPWTQALQVAVTVFFVYLLWLSSPYVFLFASLVPTLIHPRWDLFFIRVPFLVVAGLRHK